MKRIEIDVDRELELAHNEYEAVKKAVLFNQKYLKTCYKKLYTSSNISKETYEALIRISNSTVKFIKMKEI